MLFFSLSTAAILSFIGIIAMITFRLWELGRGYIKPYENTTRSSQSKILQSFDKIIKKESAQELLRYIFNYIKSVLLKLLDIIKYEKILGRQITRISNSLKGRRAPTQKKTNSEFLKTIAEHKRKMRENQ